VSTRPVAGSVHDGEARKDAAKAPTQQYYLLNISPTIKIYGFASGDNLTWPHPALSQFPAKLLIA